MNIPDSGDAASRLSALSSSVLASALCELAERDVRAGHVVERLLLDEAALAASLGVRIKAFGTETRFYEWKETDMLVSVLEDLLADIREGIKDPWIGLELVADFYRIDGAVMERCNDDGEVGSVFSGLATDLLLAFARDLKGRGEATPILRDLARSDAYGCRSRLRALLV